MGRDLAGSRSFRLAQIHTAALTEEGLPRGYGATLPLHSPATYDFFCQPLTAFGSLSISRALSESRTLHAVLVGGIPSRTIYVRREVNQTLCTVCTTSLIHNEASRNGFKTPPAHVPCPSSIAQTLTLDKHPPPR